MAEKGRAEKDLQLVKELSEASGVPGYESEIAGIVTSKLSAIGAAIDNDYMGNVFGTLVGSSKSPRVMLAAHMDEVGLVVHSINDDGTLKFIVNGAWWHRLMLQQPVLVKASGGNTIPGIISIGSSFFSSKNLDKLDTQEMMYIDIGASGRNEAVEDFGIWPGDCVVFDSPFRPMANSDIYAGKAFDNRLGLATIIESMKTLGRGTHPNTAVAAVTVQEEVGRRGASAAASFCKPDVAIIVEGPPADDIPAGKNRSQCAMGRGVHIRRQEPGFIASAGLHRFVISVAEEAGIRFQMAVSPIGGTDGAVIHKAGIGIPTIMFGVPVRYAHAHHGLFHSGDYMEAVKLLTAIIQKLDSKVLEEVRKNPYG